MAMYQNPYMMNPYLQQYQPQFQQPVQQPQSGLIWVQGVEGAKSHPISAGQTVLLMDSESNAFFIKTADASGMPLPLRVFDYSERTANGVHKSSQETRTEPSIDLSAYVTRDEMESRISEILAAKRYPENQQKGGQNNGK